MMPDRQDNADRREGGGRHCSHAAIEYAFALKVEHFGVSWVRLPVRLRDFLANRDVLLGIHRGPGGVDGRVV